MNETRDYIGTPWIGVDLDGTLAYYDGWKGYEHIGEPIQPMLRRVLTWLEQGKDVRIFTARVSLNEAMDNDSEILRAIYYINIWCKKHIGRVLPITCTKDRSMIKLWDDRCVQVVKNTGETIVSDIIKLAKEQTDGYEKRIKDMCAMIDIMIKHDA